MSLRDFIRMRVSTDSVSLSKLHLPDAAATKKNRMVLRQSALRFPACSPKDKHSDIPSNVLKVAPRRVRLYLKNSKYRTCAYTLRLSGTEKHALNRFSGDRTGATFRVELLIWQAASRTKQPVMTDTFQITTGNLKFARESVNIFDSVVINYVNQFSQQSRTFDMLLAFLADNHLLKGGVLVTMVWWLWFKKVQPNSRAREQLIATFIGCIAAMGLARLMALTLPFRLRPLHETGLHFLLPYGTSPTVLDGWSSFPSDHAALFFALSTGLLFVSRKAGLFALAYTTLFIAFPRIYLGLHYPTDIIAGAVIGMTIALLSNIYLGKSARLHSIANWSDTKPQFFYPVLFLFTYQIADLFSSSRALIGEGLTLFKNIVA
ncbi:MAG: phosphatase PAP2 family protein [Burkholderiaceae bacterium]